MTVNSIIEFMTKLIDVLLVWLLLYYILKNLRRNVKMVLIFKGVLIIALLKVVSYYLHLVTIDYLLDYVMTWGPLAIIVIFQPEIRNILEHLGRSQLLGRHKLLTVDEREKMVYEIVSAMEVLKKERIGALIVIERDNSLTDYIEKSKKIYADISSDLLISIFFPNNPLHDGGVIIQGDKITSAGAVFPTSDSLKISKRLGTRHRAALGISEESDAVAIVVSEETGKISVAIGGVLNHNLSIDDVRMLLVEELKPKSEILLDDEFENDEDSKDGDTREND